MTRPGFIFEDETSVPNEVEEDELVHRIRRILATESLKRTSNSVMVFVGKRNGNALFSLSRKQPGSVSHSLNKGIMTKCEELQFDLPLYFDGSLNAEERSAIDVHLPECPLCRQKLDEFEHLSVGLKAIPRFSPPDDLVEVIRTSVAARLSAVSNSPSFHLIERRRSWTEIWLMPLSAAAAATLVLGFTLLTLVLSSSPTPLSAYSSTSETSMTPVFRAASNLELTPDEYANTRLAISGESPSVNPRGALVALTRSLVRGEMRDDEVVVVADVFGNGLAQIAEVVEPSHDRYAVEELQRALQSDPAYAPFVPASMDKRSETIRVVFKIQNVNVRTYSDTQ